MKSRNRNLIMHWLGCLLACLFLVSVNNINVNAATKLQNVTIMSVSQKGLTDVTIKWKYVSGSTGYEVRMSDKQDSGYKKVVSTTSKEASIKNLKANKTYYFKVRAYRNKDGQKSYGGYSKIVKVSTKSKFTISPTSKPFNDNYVKSSGYVSETKQYFLLRSYLERLEDIGGGTLTLKAGTYDIPRSLFVPSNVNIVLNDGVVINKTSKVGKSGLSVNGKLFIFVRTKDQNKKNATEKYAGVHDVSIKALGSNSINVKAKDTTIFTMAHNNNISFEGLNINISSDKGRAINMFGCSNVQITNCKFKGNSKDSRGAVIDIPASKADQTLVWAKCDDTVCKNITFTNSKFDKLENAIYSQRFMKDKYHDKIIANKCKFTNIKDDAIIVINWKNPQIKSCEFDNIGSGGVAKKTDVKVAIRMYGVKTPTIKQNKFKNTEKTMLVSDRENTDPKLKSQGRTVIDVSLKTLEAMSLENTVENLGFYYVNIFYSKTGLSSEKFWFADTKRSYTMTVDQKPYRNQFVTLPEYNEKSRNYYTFRSYLEQMERNGGGTLTLESGTYLLSDKLRIPSNVKIYLKDGVNLKCTYPEGKIGPLFELYNQTDGDKGVKYSLHNGVHDVSIIGPDTGTAVIDRKSGKGTIFTMVHSKNITVKNITMKNMDASNSHMMEIDASQNVNILNNTFTGSTYTGDHKPKEAINLDIPDENTEGVFVTYSTYDCTPNEGVTIKNNVFKHLAVGIGSHMYTPDHPHSGIVIEGNTFDDMDYYAVRGMNWKKPVINNNVIKNIGSEDYGQAIYFEGVEMPTFTNNKIDYCALVMKTRIAAYTESTIAPTNTHKKQLLKYVYVYNEFSEDDLHTLGFFNNTIGKNVALPAVQFGNELNPDYQYWYLIEGVCGMDDLSADEALESEVLLTDDEEDISNDMEIVEEEIEVVENFDEESVIEEETVDEQETFEDNVRVLEDDSIDKTVVEI